MAALAEKLTIARHGHNNANFWTENYVHFMPKLSKKTYLWWKKSKNTALVTVPGDGLTSGPPGKEVVAEGGGGVE